MNERIVHLRIKIQSLVDEARNIRREANKASGMAKWNLNQHRKTTVREHSRVNLLAYGALRGMPYSAMEKKCYEQPNFTAVAKHAKTFGGDVDDIAMWVNEAEAYLKEGCTALKLAS